MSIIDKCTRRVPSKLTNEVEIHRSRTYMEKNGLATCVLRDSTGAYLVERRFVQDGDDEFWVIGRK